MAQKQADNTSVPTIIIGNELKDLLDSFCQLTDMRVAYFSLDTSDSYSIVGQQRDISPFCRAVRSNTIGLSACLKCDNQALSASISDRDIHIYRCHMGLYEAIVPIFLHDRYSGFLMFGQVRNSDSDSTTLIEQRADELGLSAPSLINAYNALPSFTFEKIHAAAKMLSIISKHIIHTGILRRRDQKIINEIDSYIRQHLSDPISVRDLVKHVHLNAAYLTDMMKHQTGSGCLEYIHRIKLNTAKELLITSDMSIGEISLKLGFTDQNYFTRLFKRYYGSTPTQYRQNI